MLPSRFQHCLGPVETLIPEDCSEALAFGNSSNQNFHSLKVQKYLSQENDLFHQNAKNFLWDFKNAIKICKYVFGFQDSSFVFKTDFRTVC